MKRYAISDIHGCLQTFRLLVEDLIILERDDELYLLGDYIDRGPDSKGVIDYILDLKEKGYKVHTLRGNHEQMMLDALHDPVENFERWIYNGGYEALKSFGLEQYGKYSLHPGLFDEKYLGFIGQLEYCLCIDGYYLAHAGINFAAEDPFNDRKSMLWMRNPAFDPRYLETRKLVHGHTPVTVEKIKASLNERIIDIDGGCVFDSIKGLGHLVALDLDLCNIITVPLLDKIG